MRYQKLRQLPTEVAGGAGWYQVWTSVGGGPGVLLEEPEGQDDVPGLTRGPASITPNAIHQSNTMLIVEQGPAMFGQAMATGEATEWKEAIDSKVDMGYRATGDMVADGLTKGLGRLEQVAFVRMCNLASAQV